MVPIVLSKVGEALRVEWGKFKDPEKETIDELLKYINTHLTSLEESRQVENAFAPNEDTGTKRKPQNIS